MTFLSCLILNTVRDNTSGTNWMNKRSNVYYKLTLDEVFCKEDIDVKMPPFFFLSLFKRRNEKTMTR